MSTLWLARDVRSEGNVNGEKSESGVCLPARDLVSTDEWLSEIRRLPASRASRVGPHLFAPLIFLRCSFIFLFFTFFPPLYLIAIASVSIVRPIVKPLPFHFYLSSKLKDFHHSRSSVSFLAFISFSPFCNRSVGRIGPVAAGLASTVSLGFGVPPYFCYFQNRVVKWASSSNRGGVCYWSLPLYWE